MQNVMLEPADLALAEEISELVVACDIDEYGQPDFVLEDLLDICSGIPLATNSWMIRMSGEVAAFAFLEENGAGRLSSYGYVHPKWKKRGLGSLLLEGIENRAREYVLDSPETAWSLSNVIPALSEAARQLLETGGYVFQRKYSRMSMEMQTPPALSSPPNGISIDLYNPVADEDRLWSAYRETFQDTRTYYEVDKSDWLKEKSGTHYDRNFWFAAHADGQLAGFVISKNFGDHLYVDLLGVRRPWRKQGIARALLERVFQAAYTHGIGQVLLSVDDASLTGANRLYEAIGMKALFQMAFYEKKL
ncbi:acetyltransferase (GNAT) family protein [Fontibacillus phaseoli]|uniref:Acetyltransferase (GNAT) family protein n=1 Tax=Fontibacillus phaseoli TaxID=1416533 RepID=A0A369B587_9BACL|nr:GNAT family N-acetyltransferase [Fontibacillus phaseoli]RCX16672.1 acetyltransferase (GNAT) family protein [Fontibacillus phaseoli]